MKHKEAQVDSGVQEVKKETIDFERYLFKPVRVVWRDAHFYEHDWKTPDDIDFEEVLNIIQSFGVLVKYNEHVICLAMNFCPDDKMCSNVFFITKAQVLEVYEVK